MIRQRDIPQNINLPELSRTFNRVWDAINQSDNERRESTNSLQSSVSSLSNQVNNLFTATFVTRFEVENDGVQLISDELGHTKLVPYTLKVLA